MLTLILDTVSSIEVSCQPNNYEEAQEDDEEVEGELVEILNVDEIELQG